MVQKATEDIYADLNDRQKMFCEEYLKCGCNATRAAIAAGYSEHAARSIAYENLRKPHIRRAINAMLEDAGYAPEFVKQRLDVIARSRLTLFEPWLSGAKTFEELEAEGVDVSLVKSAAITQNKYGENRKIELHDALKTVDTLAKCHGMFADVAEAETPAPSREMVRRVVIEEYEQAGDAVESGVPGIPTLTLHRATGGPPNGGNGKAHHGGNGNGSDA